MATKICVATSFTPNFAEIGEYAAMTLELYAKRHGLATSVTREISLDRPAPWHRVKLIPELFDQGFEYVLWIDADAIFRRFDVPIQSIINGVSDLYMVEHPHPAHPNCCVPNTGVMLVRNCDWSRKLFETLWSMTEYADHYWWENAAIIKLLGYTELLGEGPNNYNREMLEHITFISTEWNFIPSVCNGRDPIIKHYAGYSHEVRVRELPKDALRASFNALTDLAIGDAGRNSAAFNGRSGWFGSARRLAAKFIGGY